MTVSFHLDAAHGGRLSSLRIGTHELIYNEVTDSPTSWGAYPMVPYAGRVNEGRFSFADNEYQLPINHRQHAIHGTAFTAPWQEVGQHHLVHELDDRWPLGGTVAHLGEAFGDESAGQLVLTLSVLATASPMPAMLGWHPWFNRQLEPDGPAADLRIAHLASAEMYEVDESMIPTGNLVSPPAPGPWDHPFRSVTEPIEIVWEGQLKLELSSTCDHWVIYDRPEHALCVEPQSGPPDIFNGDRFDVVGTVLQPGEELSHTFTLAWTAL